MVFFKSLFYGVLAAFAALVLQIIFKIIFFSEESAPANLASPGLVIAPVMIIFAAISEEIIKYSLIYRLYVESEGRTNIIKNAIFLGLGFSLVELTFNLIQSNSWLNITNVYFWGLLLVHLTTVCIYGYIIQRHTKINAAFLIIVLLLVIGFHLAYNFSVLYLLK
jgi:hypothetical protein